MYIAAPVNGNTYQWYNPGTIGGATNTSYTANTTGSYFVVETNNYGCSGTSSIITITLNNCNSNCNAAPYTLTFNKINLSCNKDSFAAIYSAGIINPTWNFNDPYNPSSATGFNTSHTFTEPGFYADNIMR